MKEQQYSNHAKYYAAHHFVFYPLVLVALVFSATKIFSQREDSLEWMMITVLWIFIIWLSLMLRQHYALGNQNRIVRLELRLRYFILTQQRLEALEDKLSFGHIAALRFAPDEELPELVRRAVNENLTPDEIKKSIRNWLADDMRV